MRYIDIHNHFAWGIDDGIGTKEETRKALKKAQVEGVGTIIATPHFIPGKCNQITYEAMTKRMEELKELAKEYHIDVYMGSEVFLNEEYLEMIDEKLFHTLANSKYVLCEFDVRKNIDDHEEAEDKLYEITVRDMIPVIAHIERYFAKGIDIKRVEGWIAEGYVIQVNRTSLLGIHGEMAKKNAWKLIKKGMVHVIASDAHQAEGRRVCKFQDIYELLQKEIGKENADILCYRNANHIIENEEVEEIEMKKKKWWKRR